MRNFFFLLSFLFISSLTSVAMKLPSIVSDSVTIGQLFWQQLSVYPQEKAYIHTDKLDYVAGDTVWMRIHLVEATLLKQANASRYVYVEMIDKAGKFIDRVMIRPDSLGCFYGYLPLTDGLAQGCYTLRAYTRFMRNMGEEYFFRRALNVVNPIQKGMGSDIQFGSLETKSGEKMKRKHAKASEIDFDVAFFPEGGQAPLGASVRMAFKAIGFDGLGREVYGTVYDEEGNVCATFASVHRGMGTFMMFYRPGHSYHAVCTTSGNKSLRFDLPKAVEGTLALRVLTDKKYFRIAVCKAADTALPEGMRLVAQVRGVVLYDEEWDASRQSLTFERGFFPAGVVHLLLVDGMRNVLSERLVFSHQEATFARVQPLQLPQHCEPRSLNSYSFQLTDQLGNPLHGNVSVSVVDRNLVRTDTTCTLVSAFLLTSELRGYIEQPADYFVTDNRHLQNALDALLLTQGWRRYDVPSLLKGHLTRPTEYPVESERLVSGRVEGLFSNLNGGEVSLVTRGTIEAATTTAISADGRFQFHGVEYPDKTWYIIQALNKRGGQHAYIRLDSVESYSAVTLTPIACVWNATDTLHGSYVDNEERRYVQHNGIREVNLAEVEIVGTANRKTKVGTSSLYHSVSSSRVVTEEDITRHQYHTVFDALRGFNGLRVTGQSISYHGGTPLTIIDDMPYEDYDFTNLDIADVGDLFFSPPSAVAFLGPRGANGAIVINTKRGDFGLRHELSKNMTVIKPLGYQQQVSFYSPRYDTDAARVNLGADLRSTLYWKPNAVADADGVVRFEFYSADASTDYRITIEGVSSRGHLISYTF